MADDKIFFEALQKVKVPLLIIDQKWHRLFLLGGKTQVVKELEEQENELLKREASLKQELKDLKKVKENLVNSVMTNMEGTSDLVSKKLDDDKRLLEECKARIFANEEELASLPEQIENVNFDLMLETMNYCYQKLRTNSQEADDISKWIEDIKIQVKKNVVRKKNREINNKEIYSYMHDVFGMEILNIFDLQNGDFYLNFDNIDTSEKKLTDNTTDEKKNFNKHDNLANIELEAVDLDEIKKETKADELARKEKLMTEADVEHE